MPVSLSGPLQTIISYTTAAVSPFQAQTGGLHGVSADFAKSGAPSTRFEPVAFAATLAAPLRLASWPQGLPPNLTSADSWLFAR